MKYFNIILILATIFVLSSCDDFLDVESKERVEAGDSEENYTPEQFVNGVYGMFTDWDYGFSFLAVTEIISDNADKGSSPSDSGTDKNLFDELTFTSTAPSFGSMWSRWYKTIGRATQAIEYAEEYGLTDEAYKNRLIGESKFLRAVCYFWLVRGWGDVTLQHIDDINRAPKEEVYAFIEQDLTEAMQVLPASYNDANVGRATRGAAHGLLAKVYLYQEKWQEAYDAATAVINSSEYNYSLLDDYSMIWRVEGENSSESLFEIQARGESIAHGVQQYSQTQGARGTTGWGWGFNTPSENLLAAFNDEGDEIRRDATIIFRNSTLYDGYVVGNTENPMYNYKAYSSANKGASDTDKNIRYLRLGEIYLIQAEAANELGRTSEALAALNTIRDRVDLPAVTTTDQAELRRAIWKERRLELAFEHDRWFDLVRTGQAQEAMAADNKTFVIGKHELFPIPNQQLIDTPEMTQNPNW
ncbi:RagB/SusD family nutrient uptake outer membrane protein [Proteiniphilum acetatigenes]|uniref:RagB/SusD family nutrient uptake outer membrane protein n=1 Tax=Proteiniphilum acetatigenes TaxID=294710 RepID=UPI0003819DDF|nr:RagB/SusD family nutrient uptake outer membrane protein [Proteiniphilum acetatigenes]SFT02594.1 Starch-binding associating with outer membrane [Porphyromonadaceae bacterium NLAE-zl-C104]